MAEKHLLIVCGEASGDLNAASLAREILKNPRIKISAVGGQFLRDAGAEILYDIKDLSVIGLFDTLKKLPKFFALKKFILGKIKELKPDAVIFVDFSGFNLRLAKAIEEANLTNSSDSAIATIYYISPQVWASRSGRIRTIKKYIRKIIVLFKFEEEFYKKRGIKADFAGHPLLDVVRPTMEKKEFLERINLKTDRPTIALLPGSRKQEIKHILPVMLKSALLIQQQLPQAQFIIAKSPQVDWDVFSGITHRVKVDLKIVEGKTYDCLNAADFCLVASGTATLETAIMQKPFAVIYKMGLLNYLLYRPQVKLPFIGMVNIVAGKKIIPEFIQFGANPKKIARQALKVLNSSQEAERIKQELTKVKSSLGEKGASLRAAKIITDYLNSIS